MRSGSLRSIDGVRTEPAAAVRVRVPAKVNLLLAIGDARPDGYHELRTVFHAVDLYDEVTATPSDELAITISGADVAGVPADSGNLAWQAAAMLAAAADIAPRVHLHVHKTIPVAGGMAGGSADAAAGLLACARLWDLDATVTELVPLAGRLGSDVAFTLLGGTAVGTSRGEVLSPVPTGVPLHWVFALADHGLSTAAAYRALDDARAGGTAAPRLEGPERLVDALHSGDLDRIAAHLGNDLEPVALAMAPHLRDTLDAGRRHGALAGLVSGSGPTCAFLCRDADAAAALADALRAEGVCREARTATGPVPGAAVVA